MSHLGDFDGLSWRRSLTSWLPINSVKGLTPTVFQKSLPLLDFFFLRFRVMTWEKTRCTLQTIEIELGLNSWSYFTLWMCNCHFEAVSFKYRSILENHSAKQTKAFAMCGFAFTEQKFGSNQSTVVFSMIRSSLVSAKSMRAFPSGWAELVGKAPSDCPTAM